MRVYFIITVLVRGIMKIMTIIIILDFTGKIKLCESLKFEDIDGVTIERRKR